MTRFKEWEKNKPRSLSKVKEKTSKSASQRVKTGIPHKYQHQRPEPDQRETETEITHCIGYKISGDQEKRGFRGRGKN